MNNSIKTILGIKDPYLKLDEKNFDNPIEDQPNQIIVHLIQTYPMHCPKCGHLMCKNGYKTVNCLGPELHFVNTDLKLSEITGLKMYFFTGLNAVLDVVPCNLSCDMIYQKF